MTNDEAINVLKNAAWLGWSEQAEKVPEAVWMAVEALKTQLPKEDITSDCISRQEAIRIASGYCHPANIAKELAKLPSVQPSFIYCKDCKHWMPYDWMFSEIWKSQNMDDYQEDEIGCAYCDMNMSANDFCSRGERRTDGSD